MSEELRRLIKDARDAAQELRCCDDMLGSLAAALERLMDCREILLEMLEDETEIWFGPKYLERVHEAVSDGSGGVPRSARRESGDQK